MVYTDCKIDLNNGTIVRNVPVLYIGRGLTEEYGMAVINGTVLNVVRDVMTMEPGSFYRGITWDKDAIDRFNVKQ